ncbi:hypothetical protein ARMGADRAFT_1079654 [Armillaria gallica]|uniref:Uncharacterized protein n=1 Tax=Armillaria gallica TaxID=47427 RepID=A0A2H3DG27_ARMGA|nr:hypothetical protein ARMGADRAFT_1079654 [Armillaria gallica]
MDLVLCRADQLTNDDFMPSRYPEKQIRRPHHDSNSRFWDHAPLTFSPEDLTGQPKVMQAYNTQGLSIGQTTQADLDSPNNGALQLLDHLEQSAGNIGFHKTLVVNPVFRCRNTIIVRLGAQPVLNTKLR